MSILKILTDLCAMRQKNRNKRYFRKYCLQFFSGERVLIGHKKTCFLKKL